MLLDRRSKTRAFTMMVVPHYDSPVRIVRLPFAVLYGALVLLILVGSMLGQMVFRYNQMEANISNLRQGSNRRVVDLQREMLSTYSKKLDTLESQYAIISNYNDYTFNLKNEVGESVGVLTDNQGFEQILADNNLEFDKNPKPATSMPETVNKLEQAGKLIFNQASERARSLTVLRTYAQEYKDLRDRTPSGLPIKGKITSFFGHRDWTNSFHEGIDIPAPMGTPIHATASGEIVRVQENYFGWGTTVDILHRDGIITRYAHCDRTLVQKGEFVRAGQVIATVGETGNADVPHVHYEIRMGNVAVDPLKFPF